MHEGKRRRKARTCWMEQYTLAKRFQLGGKVRGRRERKEFEKSMPPSTF